MLEDAVVDSSTIEQGRESTPEQRMWTAALALLLSDARSGWLSDFTEHPETVEVQWAAWADLIDCGDQVRRICGFTGHEPQFISRKFVQFCNNNPPGSKSSRKRGRGAR